MPGTMECVARLTPCLADLIAPGDRRVEDGEGDGGSDE